jgi:predicted ABC-type ATPase
VSDPVLELLVGPNGAGKSTFFDAVLHTTSHMPFVNADVIAAERWPDDAAARSYDAAAVAAEQRRALIDSRVSFATETVFSHASKLALIRDARRVGYIVNLRVILVSGATAVARVAERVAHGDGTGHTVRADKIRSRYRRLWPLVVDAIRLANAAYVYDNSSPTAPYRRLASFRDGELLDALAPPRWTPSVLAEAMQPRTRRG